MAEQKDYNEAAATALPTTRDVQFLSDSYDALVQSESTLSKALDNFSRRLDLLRVKVSTRCLDLPQVDLKDEGLLRKSTRCSITVMNIT